MTRLLCVCDPAKFPDPHAEKRSRKRSHVTARECVRGGDVRSVEKEAVGPWGMGESRGLLRSRSRVRRVTGCHGRTGPVAIVLVCFAQENMERHAILDSIDVMPEIYDILRHCEESHLTADEKSLLATQLAPHWTNSVEARRALETAVVYTEAEEEAEFWAGLQVGGGWRGEGEES